MQANAPIPLDHPMMIAWKKYRATPEAENSEKWARHVSIAQGDALQGEIIVSHPHMIGALWATFVAGYEAASSALAEATGA